MAMLGPSGGLLSGVSQGLQLGMQRQQLMRQLAADEEARKHRQLQTELGMHGVFSDAMGRLPGVNPDTAPAFGQEMQGLNRIAQMAGVEAPAALRPENLPGALNPARAGAVTTGTGRHMPRSPAGGAFGQAPAPTLKDQGFGSPQAKLDYNWNRAYQEQGIDWIKNLPGAVLESKDPVAALAEAIASGTGAFGPQRMYEIAQHTIPLIQDAISAQENAKLQAAESQEQYLDLIKDQNDQYHRAIMSAFSGRQGPDLLNPGASLFQGTDKERQDITLLLEEGARLIQDKNAPGKPVYTWADAFSQVLTEYGAHTGLVAKGPADRFGAEHRAPDIGRQVGTMASRGSPVTGEYGYSEKDGTAYAVLEDGALIRWDPKTFDKAAQEAATDASRLARGPLSQPRAAAENSRSVDDGRPGISRAADAYSRAIFYPGMVAAGAAVEFGEGVSSVAKNIFQGVGGIFNTQPGVSNVEMSPSDKRQYKTGIWPNENRIGQGLFDSGPFYGRGGRGGT